MVNTLYLEKEIEEKMINKKPQIHQRNDSHPFAANNALKLQSKIELEMKTKITEIFNLSSNFFWYPPVGLMTQRFV